MTTMLLIVLGVLVFANAFTLTMLFRLRSEFSQSSLDDEEWALTVNRHLDQIVEDMDDLSLRIDKVDNSFTESSFDDADLLEAVEQHKARIDDLDKRLKALESKPKRKITKKKTTKKTTAKK